MIQHEVGQQRQVDFQREHKVASDRETEILHTCVDDPRLRSIFVNDQGENVTFEQAFAGEGTAFSEMVARNLDTALYQTAPKYDNGQAQPITDPAVHKQILDRAIAAIQQSKAHTLIEASRSTGGELPQGQPGNVVTPPPEDGFRNGRAENEARSKAAAQTMASEMRRLMGDQAALPASQQF
jgi:hypothetical protein